MKGNNIYQTDVMRCGRSVNKNPLIMECKKFESLINYLHEPKPHEIMEEEKKHQDYLRDASRELMSTWPNNKNDLTAHDVVDRKKTADEKISLHQLEYNKIKENDEKIRLEKIARAKELIQKVKSGPKCLESAYMECECMQSNIALEQIRDKYKKLIRDKEEEMERNYVAKPLSLIAADENRTLESKKNTEKYRKEIYQTVQDNDKNRKKCIKQCNEVAKCVREHMVAENVAEEEKERQAIMKRKEERLKNAAEDMELKKQLKLREKCEDLIDCKIMGITLNSEHKINCIKKREECKSKKMFQANMNKNFERLRTLIESSSIGKKFEEQYKKDALRNENKLISREKEYIEKLKKNKLERIQQHHDEMQRDKEKMDQKTEEYRFDIATRFKNIEINKEFEKMQEIKKRKHIEETRNVLNYQIREKQRVLNEEKEYDIKCSPTDYSKEDNFYFSYANKLLENASAKNRITYPIEKAINQYKKEQSIHVNKAKTSQLKTSTDGKYNNGLDRNCSSNLNSSIPNNCCPLELNCNNLK